MENTENFGESLQACYKLLHADDIDGAFKKFTDTLAFLEKETLKKGDDDFGYYISCLLGLGEIHMKKGEMKVSLEFYLNGNKLTEGEDFNILFNLGVVYRNLGEEDKCKEYLELAKKINPTDPNLIRFMGESSNESQVQEGSGENFDTSFENKITSMLAEINKDNKG